MSQILQNMHNSLALKLSPTSQSISPHDFKLKIKRIIGTSAADKQQISIQDDLVAYTASGGVVVCKIDKETSTVVSQRFFCANSNESRLQQHPQSGGVSSANAYLNMIKTDYTQEETLRDEYGYPIVTQPIEVYGNSVSPNDADDYFNACPSPSVNNQTSPSKLKDKVRSIKCIALSPNKRLLAIGESGYQPRILLFSLASNSQQNPIMAIYEHTFGIHNLVFSPDSKSLCSLGVVNDGSINVWRLGSNTIQLQASNRCSNVIHKVIWHDNVIVTIGLRFIKLWKVDDGSSNKPVILKGRNAHLGNFMNSNFIDMALINEDEVVIIANATQLLLLKLNFDSPKLVGLNSPDYDFCSIAVDHEQEELWLGENNSNLNCIKIEELVPEEAGNIRPASSPSSMGSSSLHQQLSGVFGTEPNQAPNTTIVRLCNFSDSHLLYLSANEEISFWNKKTRESKALAASIIRQISGVKNSYDKDYLVFSKTGTIEQFNPSSCEMSEIFSFKAPKTDVVSDCLTAIEKVGNLFILGYKFGSLYIIEQELDSNKAVFNIQAHSSTINDIVYFKHETYELICSISRDRMIQIFAKVESKWDLLQTIPVHNGNLLKVMYHEGYLYVCSTDRTISIHTLTTEPNLMMVKVKSITLKSTPLTMEIFNNDLVVSTSDKTLLVFDVADGNSSNCDFKRSMKLMNEKLNESLHVEMMSKFHNLLIVWASDKSIRGFDYESGKPIGVSWGHSDSLLGVFLITSGEGENNNEKETELVTIGNDGCLFSWHVTESAAMVETVTNELSRPVIDEPVSAYSPTPVYTKVARKILPTVSKPSTAAAPSIPSSPPKRERLLDKLEQAATGTGQKPRVPFPNSPTPQSPTPKLTAATLKRIESRNGRSSGASGGSPCASPRASTSLSPTRSKSMSPIRSSVNSRPTSPTRNNRVQCVGNGSGVLSKLNQPLGSSAVQNLPPNRPLSPSRATSDPSVNMKSSQSNSISSTDILKKGDNLQPEPLMEQSPPVSLVDRCMLQFNELISRVQELKEHEKTTLLDKINEVRYKLNDDNAISTSNQDELLNKYSDRLVELVEAKLSGSSISD
ncbi:hypothetical protein I9W82_004076 [Candida metapsilosis]|uniref:Uncharacterized protein n=1 Tax=Candida metapsilosis TaxID=273372 RepID=A0A8H7ZGC0_9ASCO|nr:hypothetical protein I9W82_004076 [Candida metapsilosis]